MPHRRQQFIAHAHGKGVSSTPMSYFSAMLSALMDSHALNQSQLSKSAKISQGQISHYLSDEAWPSMAVLTRMCKTFGDDGASLAVAFLRDHIPSHLREHIKISTDAAGAPLPPAKIFITYSRLQPKQQELIADLARLCDEDPKAAPALETVRDLLTR